MRTISELAREIRADWRQQGKGVYFAAVPYLNAMLELSSPNEMYGFDSARSIVVYFLSNAKTYRGEKARALKAELKALFPGLE
jgi:hypothetical protein